MQFEGKVKNWGEKQQAEVALMDYIARELAGGVTVHVYESYVGSDGKRYYLDSKGKQRIAHNGKYINATGDIYIDLNAGDHGEGLVLNTFGHELYHHIERRSPTKARQLAEFLCEEMGISSVEAMVEDQIKKAEAAGHGVEYFMDRGMSRTAADNTVRKRAFSDFVADSMETVFAKDNALDVIKRLNKKDKGLVQRIKAFIDKWVQKLREFYNGNKTISLEGHLASQLKTFEKMQEMFMEALSDAGENYRKGEFDKADTTAIRLSDRNAYPYNMETVIKEYLEHVDTDILNYAQVCRADKSTAYKRLNIGTVTKQQIEDAKRLLNLDFTGFSNAIEQSAINHIEKRHGIKGKADNSMRDLNDVARIGYIIANYDDVEITTDADGNESLSKQFRVKNNKPAPMLKYSKKINGTYYAVIACPDSKYKKL